MEPFLRGKPNIGRYLNALIKQDIQTKSAEPIYLTITQKLLQDEQTLAQLATKLNTVANKPVAQRGDGVEYVPFTD